MRLDAVAPTTTFFFIFETLLRVERTFFTIFTILFDKKKKNNQRT